MHVNITLDLSKDNQSLFHHSQALCFMTCISWEKKVKIGIIVEEERGQMVVQVKMEMTGSLICNLSMSSFS